MNIIDKHKELFNEQDITKLYERLNNELKDKVEEIGVLLNLINELKQPSLLANSFCKLDSHQQSIFMNECGFILNKWGRTKAHVQIEDVINNSKLDSSGMFFIELICESANNEI